MSRSYKKNPVVTDPSTNHRYKPRPKAIANRVIRRKFAQELVQSLRDNTLENLVQSNHKLYTKQYPSWDIVDYRADLRTYDQHDLDELPEETVRLYYRK